MFSTSLTELTRKLKHPFPLQKQFNDNASHELQTPLAIASAELDFLRQSQQLTQAAHTHWNGLLITFQYDVEHREHSFQIK